MLQTKLEFLFFYYGFQEHVINVPASQIIADDEIEFQTLWNNRQFMLFFCAQAKCFEQLNWLGLLEKSVALY